MTIHVKKKTNMMVLIIVYLYIGTFCGIRDTEGLHCTEQWCLNHSKKEKFHHRCTVFQIYALSLISSKLSKQTYFLPSFWSSLRLSGTISAHTFFMLDSVIKMSQHFFDHIQPLCYYSDAYRTACLHKSPRPFHISI